jgi:hypothetical protein
LSGRPIILRQVPKPPAHVILFDFFANQKVVHSLPCLTCNPPFYSSTRVSSLIHQPQALPRVVSRTTIFPIMATPSPEQRERQRLQQQQQQQQQQAQQQQRQQAWQWANFINNYPLNILFPAKVSSKDPSKKLKTDQDLINARLLESGILFEDSQKFPDLQPGVAQFIENLNQSGCFHSVQLKLGQQRPVAAGEEEPETTTTTGSTTTTNNNPIHELEVILDEKNWYSLYIGGGFKHDGVEEASTKLMSGGSGGGSASNLIGGLLPKAQFETSATFLNLTGALDQTLLRYTVDQTASSSIVLSHERPLYSWFPEGNDMGTVLLALPRGSQYTMGIKTVLDTVDYEWTRSYKESQRLISLQLDNNAGGSGRILQTPMEAAPTPNVALGQMYHWNWDWTLALRDVVPRKHATLPYAADASPEMVALSGPTMTHSMTYQIRTNGSQVNHRYQPTSGFDWHGKIQVAGPPGDVGFCKIQGGCAVHVPLWTTSTTTTPETTSENTTPVTTTTTQPPISVHALALHATISGGLLQPLHFGGICRPPTISDRFFVGGPLQLRGFLPAGIGPRAKTGGSMTPGGDALGGTLFYTGTVAASMAVLPTALQAYTGGAGGGLRVFCFVNAGTVVGGGGGTTSSSSIVTKDSIQGMPFQAIVNSTRVSTGLGLSLGTPMGRLEATYAWPLRYGPRDARSNLQFGMGFHFG